jgi:uncharacterized membrane protein
MLWARLPDNPPSDDMPRIRVRIETLSDLVFGLALSIGSIALVQHIPQVPGDLYSDVVEFGFGFLIIVGVWLGYTRIVSVMPAESAGTVLLNLALLFCVALEPFLYYVLFQATVTTFVDFSSTAYALDTGAMMGLLSGMMYLVVRQEGHAMVPKLQTRALRNFKVSMVGQAICAALFLVSALHVFWIPVPAVGY